MSIIRILFPLLFLLPASIVYAQLPPACGGASLPAIACETACINCNFDGFTGSTIGFPSVPAVDFCGTVENAQWLGFIAGGSTATFTIIPFNCLDGNGVQVALYQDCTQAPLACDKGQKDGDNIPVAITQQLSPAPPIS